MCVRMYVTPSHGYDVRLKWPLWAVAAASTLALHTTRDEKVVPVTASTLHP